MATFEESSYVVKDKVGEEEIQRLNLQHKFINIFADGESVHSAVQVAQVQNVADVATGSGIWLQELSEKWRNDGIPRCYVGFDMALSLAPTSYPKNMEFVQHNVLIPFSGQYIGTFDLVHIRLLGGALKKKEIPTAFDNIIKLLKPGGFLQWDDIDSTGMRAIPPNDFADEVYREVLQLGTALDMDLKFPYAIESLCKSTRMKDVQILMTDSLATPEMVAKTREVACLWYLDCIKVLVPIYMTTLKGATKEKAATKRDEVVEGLKRIYAGGVTPGMTMVRVVARMV